jgi:DNA invertase Pin-like site-specific DNA recombinase
MVEPAAAPLRAVIYARESKYEAKAGNRSPEEQVEVGAEWCADHDHTVVETIVDAGIGASRHSRGERPGWHRAKELITSRSVDILVTWASSRATRRLGDYVELRDMCAANNVLWCRKGRVLDLNRADDRLTSGLEAVVDDHQVEVIREDVVRTLRANARKGRPQGRTLYGYRRIYDTETRALVRQEPSPDQAWVVEALFAAYLAGHSTNTLSDALCVVGTLTAWSGGIPTSTGTGRWQSGTVRRILANPAYKGRRLHHGNDVGEAMWPALIDPKRFDRVQQRLAARSVKRDRVRRGQQLLSRLARCGTCGTRMTHMPAWRTREAFYYCPAPGRHVARSTARLDAFLTAALLERLARLDVDEPSEDPSLSRAQERLAELKAELDEAMGLWKSQRLSVAAYAEMEADLLPRIAEAERVARRAMVPLDVDVPPAEQLPEWWVNDLTAEQRREYMAAYVAAVVVQPVGKGNRWYRDEDVNLIEWCR